MADAPQLPDSRQERENRFERTVLYQTRDPLSRRVTYHLACGHDVFGDDGRMVGMALFCPLCWCGVSVPARHVVEGIVYDAEWDNWDVSPRGDGEPLSSFLRPLAGKRVRVTVEVLE